MFNNSISLIMKYLDFGRTFVFWCKLLNMKANALYIYKWK